MVTLCAGLALACVPAWGQDTNAPPPAPAPAPVTDDGTSPYEGRLVAEIRFEGLTRTDATLVENTIRTSTGRPLDPRRVAQDVRLLIRLGRFETVEADVVPLADQNVAVVFTFSEALRIGAIDVVGNVSVSNQEIATVVNQQVALIEDTDLDQFKINKARQAIEDLYRSKGYYQVSVEVDEEELQREGTVLFRVREGQQTQITGVRFEGNQAQSDKQLRPVVETKTKVLFFDAPLNQQQLEADVAAIVRHYRDRGYLDVRADREITPSPDGKEAIVTFLIDEGPLYTLRDVLVRTQGGGEPEVFSPEQVRGLINLKPGDAYAGREVRRAVVALRDAYRQIGYVDAQVRAEDLRVIGTSRVDLRLTVIEGERWRTGLVVIGGNELTRQKVIRRRVELYPDRWLDGKAVDYSEQLVATSGLFETRPQLGGPPRVIIQPPDPANPGYRDVYVEVQETNTGSLSFGAAIDSDAGVVGAISLTQRNFDIGDFPDSFDELLRGRAFRGAGQNFALTIQPGTEVSTYSISLNEPALFDLDYGLSTSAFFRERRFRQFDEERLGGSVGVSRRFGTRWVGTLAFRAEQIGIDDIDDDAPLDVFDVEGESTLTSVGFRLARTTVDNRFRPTKGTRTELLVDRVGALGGDYEFTKIDAEHTLFLTIDRDEFDRATVLSFRGRLGLIPESGEAPVFERFYLGGRTFRGFDFRGIGPVGINAATGQPGNDQVGGDALVFFGVELEKPIWQDILAVVAFVDSGTITDDLGFDDYRVSVGAGVRLYIPQLGQAPLAFDFGFPLIDQDTDERELFSFSLDLPF
ncbi:MAG: outer membrane protein assembly factor BamA [Phycisphaerales bacterium]